MSTKSLRISGLIATLSLSLGWGVGCDDPSSAADTEANARAPQAAQQQPAQQEGDSAGAQPTTSAAGDREDDDRYELRSPRRAVSVEQKEKVELAIAPGEGLKINKEFPWKLEFSAPEGVQLAQTTVSGAQIELEDSVATVPLHLEADAAGTHKLDATGDFSVCNDAKCWVIRDEPLSFELEAAKAPSEQAPSEQTSEASE